MEVWLSEILTWYQNLTTVELFWLSFGFAGQAVFGMRFIIQWIVSEREKKSVIPVIFWYLSIAGSIMLFAYATYRIDPVFMLGQGMGCFIYVRNLILIRRNQRLSVAGD